MKPDFYAIGEDFRSIFVLKDNHIFLEVSFGKIRLQILIEWVPDSINKFYNGIILPSIEGRTIASLRLVINFLDAQKERQEIAAVPPSLSRRQVLGIVGP